MSKEIIIPDLHQRHAWVDGFLAKRKHDRAIFLGDYFDDFDDTVDEAVATAVWLKSHLDDPDRLFLLGNHDLHYMFPGTNKYRGSGYSDEKCRAINDVLSPSDWAKLKPFVFSQGWWLSHAGVGQDGKTMALPNPERLLKSLTTDIKLLEKNVRRAKLWAIVWTHWRNFVPVRHANQIVGHSPGREPRSLYLFGDAREKEKPWAKDLFSQIEDGFGLDGTCIGTFDASVPTYRAAVSWCIDTNSRHIGLLNNGKFKVIKNPGKLPPLRMPPARVPDLSWILAMDAVLNTTKKP